MIVCVCKAVRDKQIQSEIEHGGPCSLEKICDKTGAGSCCGICQDKIQEMIDQAVPRDPQEGDPQIA